MDLMEAIYSRRSIRSYTDQQVEKSTVKALIQAAVQAPSALNQQPWAFAVIQDGKLPAQYSDRVKAHVLKTLKPQSPRYSQRSMRSSATICSSCLSWNLNGAASHGSCSIPCASRTCTSGWRRIRKSHSCKERCRPSALPSGAGLCFTKEWERSSCPKEL